MRLSARADYGLRALLELAVADGTGPSAAGHLAATQGVPEKFLLEILADLRRGGLVRGRRGRRGGYELARPAAEISVAEVLRCTDGALLSVHDTELDDLPYYGPTAALTEVWMALRASMREVLEHISLADVVGGGLVIDATRPTMFK